MKKAIAAIFNKFGYDFGKIPPRAPFFVDMEKDFETIFHQCKPYTMTSIERMYSLYKATEHISKHNIPGDLVECGVWKGGSAMVMAKTLLRQNDITRSLYLYDTYEGMSKPAEKDVDHKGEKAQAEWSASQTESHNEWCFSSLKEVEEAVKKTGYPSQRIRFIKGKVEDTIPKEMPEKISLLRIDTDWYESTYHELVHLYPRLSKGGILIIDDYGYWKGAREAVDKYLSENNIDTFLNRID